MSFLRKRIERRPTPTQDMSVLVGGIEQFGQRGQIYDPDVAALDEASAAVSRARLARGFGAPPIVPYGQKLLSIIPNLGLGLRGQSSSRVLDNFPNLKQLLRR